MAASTTTSRLTTAVAENLEARLLLLQRRLQESRTGIRLEKAGRGRVRLCLDAPVQLEEGLA